MSEGDRAKLYIGTTLLYRPKYIKTGEIGGSMSVRRNKWKFLSVFLLSLILLMGFATFCMASGTPGDIAIDRPAGQPPAFPNFYVVGWSVR